MEGSKAESTHRSSRPAKRVALSWNWGLRSGRHRRRRGISSCRRKAISSSLQSDDSRRTVAVLQHDTRQAALGPPAGVLAPLQPRLVILTVAIDVALVVAVVAAGRAGLRASL